MSMNRPESSGVTLVEVMVTLALMGILLALLGPSFADILNRRRVQMVAAELSNDLAFARAEAGLGGKRNDVIVSFGLPSHMSCYTIRYFGASGGCDCSRPPGSACSGQTAELRTVQIPSSRGIRLSLSGQFDPFEPNSIAFQHPRMTNSVAGFAVTVIGLRGAQLQVQVNTMGRVSTCAPSGSTMSGVSPCANSS